MAKAEGKQETIREFKPLSRLIGETQNNLAKVAIKYSLYHFRPILNIQCMEIRSPLFHNVVNKPHIPIC